MGKILGNPVTDRSEAHHGRRDKYPVRVSPADNALPVSTRTAILLLGAGLVVLVAGVYRAFPGVRYYWDGILFALNIENPTPSMANLFHPNHLLYNGFGFLAFRLARLFFPGVRALVCLQVANTIMSAAAAVVFFDICRKIFHRPVLSAWLSLMLAFSAQWWRYSIDADAYIPAVFGLLIAFRLLLDESPNPFLVGLTLGVASLFHQLAVLFFPVALAGVIRTGSGPGSRRLTNGLVLALTVLPVVGVPYLAGFAQQPLDHTVAAFWGWITSYSSRTGFSFHLWDNAYLSLRGLVRLFFQGRLSSYVESLNVIVIVLSGVFILALVRLGMVLFSTRFDVSRLGHRVVQNFRRPVLLVGIWCGIYTLFLFFFIPQNTFYRLFYLPPLVLLLGMGLSEAVTVPRRRIQLLASLVVVMIGVNFLFYIYPNSRLESNPPLELARRMNRVWGAGTVVCFARFNPDDWLLRYFNPKTSWRPLVTGDRSGQFRQWREAIRSGHPVWLETTAVDRVLAPDSPWRKQFERQFGIAERRVIDNRRHRILLYRIEPRGGGTDRGWVAGESGDGAAAPE